MRHNASNTNTHTRQQQQQDEKLGNDKIMRRNFLQFYKMIK